MTLLPTSYRPSLIGPLGIAGAAEPHLWPGDSHGSSQAGFRGCAKQEAWAWGAAQLLCSALGNEEQALPLKTPIPILWISRVNLFPSRLQSSSTQRTQGAPGLAMPPVWCRLWPSLPFGLQGQQDRLPSESKLSPHLFHDPLLWAENCGSIKNKNI